MKKTVMAAVCAATLLMGTAYAADLDFDYNYEYLGKTSGRSHYSDNEYSVAHPYYMPAKGQCRFDIGFDQEKYKFDNDNVKFLYPSGRKTKGYFVEETVALSDTWFINIKYNTIEDKLNSRSGTLNYRTVHSPYSYTDTTYYLDSYSVKEKYENWYMGLTNKFIDDDKSFGKFSLTYWQNSPDDYHAFRPTSGDSVSYLWEHADNYKDKGVILEWMYGIKGSSFDPYFKVKYNTTLNHCSKYNDGWGTIGAGIYRQCNENFGFNLGIDYTITTNIVKEKYLEGCFDVRYSIANNCALKLGYAFQLSDSQHSFDGVDYLDAEVVADLYDDKVNFKSKSRNRFFATLTYAF